ncbi:MAG: hypothetical protein JWM74_155 [Myxococcaceae bacterium]|nr:hypothetical protein [Myxococcaceae bacterium]
MFAVARRRARRSLKERARSVGSASLISIATVSSSCKLEDDARAASLAVLHGTSAGELGPPQVSASRANAAT